MRKYGVIYKATLLENLQYMSSIALGFVSYFMVIFVFIHLWDYMYSDSSQLIAGYNKVQMIWYVILTEMMWFGSRNATLNRQVTYDIQSGAIAYGINKPYFYPFYIISKYIGEITIRLSMYVILGVLFGLSFVGSLPSFRISQLPAIALVMFLGILINAVLKMSISMVSFWIEDSTPFQWLYDKLILVVGTIFPVEIFPLWMRPWIQLTPIFVVTYGPAKLVIDFSIEMFRKVLLTQVIYLGVGLLILLLTFCKGVNKINVNGG